MHEPTSIGRFTGSAAGKIPRNAFKGDVDVDTSQSAPTSDGTVFALELLLQNSLSMKVFQFETSVLNGGASLNARIPHTFRISRTRSGLVVADGDQQALTDVTMNGSIADWQSTDTLATGPGHRLQTIHTSSSKPPQRNAPTENGFAIFGDKRYIQCSKSQTLNLSCPPFSDLGNIDPKFNIIEDESAKLTRRMSSEEGLVHLEKRTGAERDFDVYFQLRVIVTLFSHRYFTGGPQLLQNNPNAGYYDIRNADCVDLTWNSNAPIPAGVRPVAEHILELQTHPRFIEFVLGRDMDLNNGRTFRTTYPVLDPGTFSTGGRYVTRWSVWDADGQTNDDDETPADDVWRAYGDTNNADHMINTEPRFNNLKTQIIQGNDPIADDRWDDQNLDDTSQYTTGERAIGAIRNVLEIFDYLNFPSVHQAWTSAANSVRDALEHFQTRYNARVPTNSNRLANLPEMWDQYLRRVHIPQITNNVQAWVERRVNILLVQWDAALMGSTGQRLDEILAIIEGLHVLQEAAQNAFINTNGLT